MPPTKKTASKKPVKDESSSSEDEQVQTKVVEKVAEKPVAKTEKKTAPKKQDKPEKQEEQKAQEKAVFKAPEKKGKWEELSNDGSDHDEPEFDNDDEHQEAQKVDNKFGPKRGAGARYEKSATNFDYSQYANLNEPIGELNSRDLMKVLIVRSYNEGQHQLCKTLKQTLRAMNLECDFPFANTNRREQHSSVGNNGAPRAGFNKGQNSGFAGNSGNPNGGFERRNGPASARPYSREERQTRQPFRKNDHATYDM